MSSTNHFFETGKISYLLDAQAGSSAKGVISSWIIKNQDINPFLCTTNSPNASHTVMDGDFEFVFKVLSSGAYLTHKFSSIYIGPGAIFSVKDLLKEMEVCKLDKSRIRIHPFATIVQSMDEDYEKGISGLDGEHYDMISDGTMKTGTTASGSGAAKARKILRRPSAMYAKDATELSDMICTNFTEEILDRLVRGESGFHDLCQGFQLSLSHPKFAPYTTSRNVTIAAALDDMMLPPAVVGNLCVNCRTYPIRIHSKKYISIAEAVDSFPSDSPVPSKYKKEHLFGIEEKDGFFFISSKGGVHLTWDEMTHNVVPYETIDSYSGSHYEDQVEIDWDTLTVLAGSDTPIFECTTLTKLPRRVFTFSKDNLEEAMRYNTILGKTFVSVTFANYVDMDMEGQSEHITGKFNDWLKKNIFPAIQKMESNGFGGYSVMAISTGKYTDNTIPFNID